jgi:hypothetical protein
VDKIKKLAEEMAIKKVVIGMNISVYKHRIKDNPYRHHKKNCVIWHNCFYDKCREIGRNI